MTNPLNVNGPDYQAGYIDGAASRQPEIERLEDLADRYYRAAFNDERRILAPAITAIELEEHRRLQEPPPSITPAGALASWVIDTNAPSQAPTQSATPTRRRTLMTTRTIAGNLAADPEVVTAGTIQITKLRVIENTGEYRNGTWRNHDTATTHFVEARFELGDNAASSLHKGDAVIVIGREHTTSWGSEGAKYYGRVVEAESIGADLTRATVTITRNPRPQTAVEE